VLVTVLRVATVVRVPVATHGHAPTLDEATAKFRENWTSEGGS